MISECPLSAEQVATFHRDGDMALPGFPDVGAFQPAHDAMDSDPDFGGMTIDRKEPSTASPARPPFVDTAPKARYPARYRAQSPGRSPGPRD